MLSTIKFDLKTLGCAVSAIALIVFVMFDSRQHFDAELIELKKKNHSGQRNWNLFYGQENVYHSGGIKHLEDLKTAVDVIEHGSAIFADVATSYYLLSGLPVYARNVHVHHGRRRLPTWDTFIAKGVGCYLDAPEYLQKFADQLKHDRAKSKSINIAPVKYMVVNTAHYNNNFTRDCLSQRRGPTISVLKDFAKLVFDGDTLHVYELPTTAAQSH